MNCKNSLDTHDLQIIFESNLCIELNYYKYTKNVFKV